MIALSALLVSLAGCVTGGARPGLASLTPGGAPGGAVASSIIAEMNGGLIGGQIGEQLSGGDRRMALEAEYRALEYTPAGQAVKWEGGDGSGEVVAAQPYRVGSQDCRQYSQSVSIAGQRRTARGTACRNADGGWTPLT